MAFAAAISEHPLATHAIGEVIGQVLERLGPEPDAALLFATAPFAGAFEDLAAAVHATLSPGSLVGATAASVIGGGREVEGGAAISLFAANVGARIRTVRFEPRDGAPGGPTVAADLELAGVRGTLVLLAEPRVGVADLIDELTVVAPDLQVVGGIASAPGGNRLAVDRTTIDRGAVGLLLPPSIAAMPVLSQGADPVGDPFVVTRSSGRMIDEIAGRPALDLLLAAAAAASPEDRSRMARSLELGVAVDERRPELERDDFLLVPVLGADKERRAVAVGREVAVGTTVQFHVRDRVAADDDLRALLAGAPGRAALAFTSTARGVDLFGAPHHDAAILADHVESGAVAGMFTAGEVGPVGGRSALHDRSASILLLDAAAP
ncbi:MAG: FIST N-terminal domain-containing protein [Acidimicrobiales bacterium]